MTNKFWNIATDEKKKKCNISLFGFVGGSKEWGDGFNEKDFLDEMSAIPEDCDLEISINSFGGSVYTALSIYAMLKKRCGAVNIRIDGAAMSAATIISSVPNAKVTMPKGSMMMIHKVSTAVAGNIEDLRKAANDMEKLENNIIDIYAEKTKKKCEEIREYVNAETYFTAQEAVDFGLADELDETTEVSNFADGDFVSLNGQRVEAKKFGIRLEAFNRAEPKKATATMTTIPVNKKERKPMTLEKLKAECPELVEQIRNEAINEGAKNERARIAAIEDVAVAGFEDLVKNAKFGEEVMTAEQLAVAILKADKERKTSMLANRKKDAQDLAGVEPNGNLGVSPKNEQEEKEREAMINAGRAAFNRKAN